MNAVEEIYLPLAFQHQSDDADRNIRQRLVPRKKDSRGNLNRPALSTNRKLLPPPQGIIQDERNGRQSRAQEDDRRAHDDGKPSDCSIPREMVSGKNGIDRPSSAGGGRDGRSEGKLEKMDGSEVVGGARRA